MSQNIPEDVVSALLAGRDSPLVNTSKKTSQSSRRKPKCSGNSTKPTKARALNRVGGVINHHKEDSTDADNRLREFTFPSDRKSLLFLLMEAPYLPPSVHKKGRTQPLRLIAYPASNWLPRKSRPAYYLTDTVHSNSHQIVS